MSTSSQARRPGPLSEHALRILIRVAIDKGYYRESFHAEHEHPERNLSIDDVIHGLEREDWTLAEPPYYNDEHNRWRYHIMTVDIEGDRLEVIIVPYQEEKRFEVITRW